MPTQPPPVPAVPARDMDAHADVVPQVVIEKAPSPPPVVDSALSSSALPVPGEEAAATTGEGNVSAHERGAPVDAQGATPDIHHGRIARFEDLDGCQSDSSGSGRSSPDSCSNIACALKSVPSMADGHPEMEMGIRRTLTASSLSRDDFGPLINVSACEPCGHDDLYVDVKVDKVKTFVVLFSSCLVTVFSCVLTSSEHSTLVMLPFFAGNILRVFRFSFLASSLYTD